MNSLAVRGGLGEELIGFNARTGQPVQAAAGLFGGAGRIGSLGSYQDLSTDFYKTYQHENWQHPGSSGWSFANMPGWGNNPNLQMFPRRAVGSEGGGTGVGGMVLFLVGALGIFAYVMMSEASKKKG